MNESTEPAYEYDVALSFAGEQRDYVEQVANGLKVRGVRVFYDGYEQASLWGKNLHEHFEQVFSFRAGFCVIFASEQYAAKAWPRHELRVAQARALEQREREYILPVRFDGTHVPGLPATVAYADARSMSPGELVELIVTKLSMPHSQPADVTNSNPQEGALTFHVLGRYSIYSGERAIPRSAWENHRSARQLIAMLLESGDEGASTEELEHRLRGEEARIDGLMPSQLEADLRAASSILDFDQGGSDPTRTRVDIDQGRLTLRLGTTDQCDLYEFETAASRCIASSRSEERKLQDGMAAVRAYNGEFLVGEESGIEDWVESVRAHLRDLLVRTISALCSMRISAQDQATCIHRLTPIFERDPWDTGAVRALMLLHHGDGNASNASYVFHRYRQALRDELGMAPPTEIVDLHARILGTE